MPLVTTRLAVTYKAKTISAWTQTLRLAASESGTMTWRRTTPKGYEAERWTLDAGGVPIREVVEGTLPPRKGERALGKFRIVVAYGAKGADVLVEQSGRAAQRGRVPAPVGLTRGLSTPGRYRRLARAGGKLRCAKFDAFRLKWDTIEVTYLGTRGGQAVFRERNLGVPAMWIYTLDQGFGIAGIDLGDGRQAIRVPERLVFGPVSNLS